ncbi:MAG: SDR family NAD(P)-dependent oxidoreductase [Gammaproteobacteria bacterium]
MKTRNTTRRLVLQSGSALAISALLPRSLWAAAIAFEDIPRSDYVFATTCDDVAASHDLAGKTALITGCNSGLGYESMRTFVEHGAHVIGTARTMEKAQKACASVLGKDSKGKATPLVCELTDMQSVVDCSNAVTELDVPIDILMCNAGVMALPKLEQVDIDGVMLERQFVINHLGHYLLTRRVLPQVEAASAPRVVWISSTGYTLAPKGGIQFDNLSGEVGYNGFKAYGQTKLANILMSNEISRRYADEPLTSNAIHPGIVGTNLGRYITGKPRDPNEPLRKGMKTPPEGAATQVYVAIDKRLDGVSGYYFEDCNPVALKGDYAGDPELAAKLWDVSDELVGSYL